MVALSKTLQRAVGYSPAVQGALHVGAIASSVLYIAADLIGARRYPGYSWRDQQFSELTAQGAPTRPLELALVEIPYNQPRSSARRAASIRLRASSFAMASER